VEGWQQKADGVVKKKRSYIKYLELPYNPKLRQRAKELRKAGNLSEVLLWNQLKRSQFEGYDFDRQRIIGDFIVDFFCTNLGLVIEVDGSSHDNKQEYDQLRQLYLEGLGLTVFRVSDLDVMKNMNGVLQELREMGEYNSKYFHKTIPLEFRLTFEGWQECEELKKVRKDSKQVFLAMGYGIPETEDLFENHLRALIDKKLGLKLNILRENLKNGIVDNLMRSEITKSCLLLAEMTHYNRGAYWEAGFAEGLGMPVIYLANQEVLDSKEPSIKPHFDVNHCTFVPWSETTIELDMQQLEATIRRAIPDKVK
jgi:very-short-patch-repair endonuclease